MMPLEYFINNKNVKIKNKNGSLFTHCTSYLSRNTIRSLSREKILEKSFLIKTETCRLMHEFNQLLARHTLDWSNISLIGASQGPAPFTTLRALITTLNGISFAKNTHDRG